MYAILQVIFGVAWEADAVLDEACDDEIPGFERPYNGDSDGWGYFGVDLGGFDECSLTYMDEHNWVATPALEAEYEKMVNALDADLAASVRAKGKPRVVIVPSTS